ncbi:hypothetical protein CLAFUW4_09126 [Fulvia fulva]|uniref:Uncharacterized protein n=1 Tax=Passalora fulva TaxID=5499 RepID=A0A9Q8UTR2_PASFU|nr:uncharacterized protein CLAFUR5_09237 [Fulvia fulva]KAK4613659.1 hypothetical protein CLAFUR4_09132 [Fulvia fulva]KAK4614858.1 hypothetical protein CLAFUR0_09124 [Fulvia fulva]UJO22088.1 hypothetical protein CLAFUR5_09237 [Fulvia fulva]WPV20396.1 hypothetical protein CLAFUW4_09126 [Fulvia fulva]WPV35308.1 hypothetical protein CLAFUW7_09127 [Fulvia fulva]
MSAEDIGMAMTVSYQDDQGVDLITSMEADGNGDECCAFLSKHFLNPPRPRPNLSKCSVRFGRPPGPTAPDPEAGGFGIVGRANGETEKC